MLHIGTCSWKYDFWKGIIYPDKEKFNFLGEYSKHYNTVEVDQCLSASGGVLEFIRS